MKQILLLISLLSLAACTANQNYANKRVEVADLKDKPSQIIEDYRIGIGDTIRIDVWKNPDLSGTVPVRPDGKISGPLIGDILVAGFTPEDVARDVEYKLGTYIKSPQVAVIVASLDSTRYLTRVRVTGAVFRNVSLQHHQGMTVLDAILEAGGLNEFANADETKIFRRENDETILIPIKLDQILKAGNLTDNIILKPGDTITVPERAF